MALVLAQAWRSILRFIITVQLMFMRLTAMDQYYQNGPLPTWIAWYAHHLPHAFHAATAVLTLVLELVLILAVFLPRRFRIFLFFIITPWQIGIILTSNYAFLNYLVLVLGFLLLDDKFLKRFPSRRPRAAADTESSFDISPAQTARAGGWEAGFRLWVQAFFLTWVFYATSVLLLSMFTRQVPLPTLPVRALEPFRIANDFGLFAVMTRDRYEIEFQGSRDGQIWTAYPFRYKPQDLNSPPRIYAPYQPRFDWNLWFASLGSWREYPFVLQVEQRLLVSEPDVIALFAGNPFPHAPPRQVRAVIWQYWFTTPAEKRSNGMWWRRQLLGLYAPTLERQQDGRIAVREWPQEMEPRE